MFCQRYIHRGWHTFLWGSGSNRRQVFIIQLFAFFNLSISVLCINFSAMYYRKTTKTIFPHLCYLPGLCRTMGERAGPRLTTASTQSTRAGWFCDSSLGYLLSSSQLDCSWYSNILMKTAQQARAICLILKKPKTLTIFFSSGQCNYRKDCPGRQRCVRNK